MRIISAVLKAAMVTFVMVGLAIGVGYLCYIYETVALVVCGVVLFVMFCVVLKDKLECG